jgi:hypothetical protein
MLWYLLGTAQWLPSRPGSAGRVRQGHRRGILALAIVLNLMWVSPLAVDNTPRLAAGTVA